MAVALVAIASNDKIASVSDGGTTTDTLYTSAGVTTQINQITCVNTSTTVAQWVSFWILPSGVAASTVAPVWEQTIPVSAGAGIDATVIIHGLLGHIIPAGGTLKCSTFTTNVVTVNASGISVS